jgi:hypothetical protein
MTMAIVIEDGGYWGFFGSLNMKYMTMTTVAQKTTCLCQKRISPNWRNPNDSAIAPIVIVHRSRDCSMTALAQMAKPPKYRRSAYGEKHLKEAQEHEGGADHLRDDPHLMVASAVLFF